MIAEIGHFALILALVLAVGDTSHHSVVDLVDTDNRHVRVSCAEESR